MINLIPLLLYCMIHKIKILGTVFFTLEHGFCGTYCIWHYGAKQKITIIEKGQLIFLINFPVKYEAQNQCNNLLGGVGANQTR